MRRVNRRTLFDTTTKGNENAVIMAVTGGMDDDSTVVSRYHSENTRRLPFLRLGTNQNYDEDRWP